MKVFACAIIFLIGIVSTALALKCLQCTGSEVGDCAKGLKSAGVAVKCEAYRSYGYGRYDPEESSTESASTEAGTDESTTIDTTTRAHRRSSRPRGCFQPIKMYPACVSYTMKTYNGVDEGMRQFVRGCMVYANNFCESMRRYDKDISCTSCNSTDYCNQ